MERPAGRQMIFLRALIESRPFLTRIPDQSLFVGGSGSGGLHMQATRDRDGTYAFIYTPMNDQTVTLNLSKLRTQDLRAWWYDPRTGIATLLDAKKYGAQETFKAPPYGPDWVLVLDAADAHYSQPGLRTNPS
jgi:hypothetical protein